ncbi:anhydro-N-acetylmuramic acid kinase [Kordiimonas laminariae]|uniref:anhydro-N-acetylmuramic acid kinase n=1 Tax=Kordiimonas laminariae TaxID=2917717 RepID=UPI001FF55714|nr:anhydro-N-acetylmuramic acid kinase [Kordiimonas laminariae]MCK0069870.1 anhydro-N-acetylmuramic acid kinase [Kordiimonas laminariae]
MTVLGETGEVKCAIGLMSGTSMDGVDAAMLYTDGVRIERMGPSLTIEYPQDLRDRIRKGLDLAYSAGPDDDVHPCIRELETEITDWHGHAVEELLSVTGQKPDEIDLIGFHGQTLTHRPDRGWTWQIGDGGRLAGKTGITVVNDFRTADVKNGGEGAPLVPLYHAALLARARKHQTVAVLNIGGVANVTWVSFENREDGPEIIAFDTGPGNAMLDDWAKIHTGEPCDTDGALAARGRSHDEVVMGLLASPYFDEEPPKTLDRDDFNIQTVRGLSPEDGAASLTDFMVESVVAAQSHFPKPPEAWFVCGGGRHNPTIMRRLRKRIPVLVDPVEVLGWRGDALEAEAFAFLAARSERGLPLSIPSTTGCAAPTKGGEIHFPQKKRFRR